MALDLTDYSQNSNTLQEDGAVSEYTTTSPFTNSTKAGDFTNTNGLYIANDAWGTATKFSFECDVRFDSLPSGTSNYYFRRWTSNIDMFLRQLDSSGQKLDMSLYNAAGSFDNFQVSWTPSLNTWYHLAVTWDGSTKEAKFYVDDVQQGTTQTGTNVAQIRDQGDALYLMSESTNSFGLDAKVTNIRMWDDVRSLREIKAHQADHLYDAEDMTNLVGYYPLEEVTTPSFTYNASITIDNTQVAGSSNLTDFPVLISGTYDGTDSEPDIRTTANGGNIESTASGGNSGSVTVPADLAFYDDASQTNRLNHEIVSYNASTGAFEAWVNVPTLDYNDDTTIYMFYGNSDISASMEQVADVWSDFIRAYHFNEGSGTTVNDSTGIQNGTLTNSDNWGTGEYNFDGATGDEMNTGISTIPEDFSILILMKSTDTTANIYPFGSQYNSGNQYYWPRYNSGGTADSIAANAIYVNSSHGSSASYSHNLNDGNYHLFGMASKTSAVNDEQYDIFDDTTAEVTYANQWNGSGDEVFEYPIYIGGRMVNGSVDGHMQMDVKGVFALDSVLSTDWYDTFYNTALGTSTFYTMGSEVGGSTPLQVNKGSGIYVV